MLKDGTTYHVQGHDGDFTLVIARDREGNEDSFWDYSDKSVKKISGRLKS